MAAGAGQAYLYAAASFSGVCLSGSLSTYCPSTYLPYFLTWLPEGLDFA